MSNGILGGIVCDLRFDPILDNIYILWHPQSCKKPLIEPYLTVFVYNEKTGILSLVQGVQAADIINQYQPPDFPLAGKFFLYYIFFVYFCIFFLIYILFFFVLFLFYYYYYFFSIFLLFFFIFYFSIFFYFFLLFYYFFSIFLRNFFYS